MKEKAAREKVAKEKIKNKAEELWQELLQKSTTMNVRTKIWLCFMLPVLLIMLLGIASYTKSSKSLIKNYEQMTSQSLDAVSDYLSFAFDSVASLEAEVLTHEITQAYVQEVNFQPSDPQYNNSLVDIFTYLKLKRSCNKLISNICLIPTNYQIVVTDKPVSSNKIAGFYGELAADPAYNFKAMGAWISEHPLIDEKAGIDPDSYAMSFYRKFSTAKAAVFFDIDSTALQEILGGLDFGENAVIALIAPDGKEIGRDGAEKNDFFEGKDYYESSRDGEAAQGYSYVRVKGKSYLYVFSKINNGAMLCALVPRQYILREAVSIRNLTVFLIILAVGLNLLLGFYLSRNISDPIYGISQRLSKISSGDLTVDFSSERKDEFGKLSQNMTETIAHIRELITETASVSGQVSESAGIVVEHSERMAEFVEQVNDAMDQVSVSIESEAKDAQSCVNDMTTLSEVILGTNDNVAGIQEFAVGTSEMIISDIEKMNALKDKSDQTSEIMDKLLDEIKLLEAKSKSVNDFVKIINEIAKETNLLSLNASIEAARAGESGNGFAVVAMEIRKLSEESAKAANRIHMTADEIKEQTEITVDHVRAAGEIVELQNNITDEILDAFEDLKNKITLLMHMVGEIDRGMKEMASARITTLDSISNISASTEENYSLSVTIGDLLRGHEDASKALEDISRELREKSDELKKAISRFRI